MSDAEIMRLLEGSLGEQHGERAKAHLRECGACFESYRDSAIVRGLWADDESVFAPTSEMVETAARIGARPVPEGTAREVGGQPTPRPTGRPYRRWGLAAGAAVAAIIVGLVWLPRGGNGPGDGPLFTATIVSPVRSAIETASARGPFVLPGGEGSLDRMSPVYRSAFVPVSDSLSFSFDRLRQSFQDGDASPDLVCLLIGGYVATGQKDAARDIADHSRLSGIADWRVAVLKALVAYMDGKHGESETLLRRVVASDPDNPVASINLAIVLSEEGRVDEALAILARVSEAHAGTPPATRAQTILSRIEDQ